MNGDEQILYDVLKAGFVDTINNTDGSVKDNSIIDAARREYVTCLDIYSNEQHSEFMAIHYGKYNGEYDKTVYRKLKKLYKSIHGTGRTVLGIRVYFLTKPFIPKFNTKNMTINCAFCKKSLDVGQNDGYDHIVCLAERNRREDDGMCVYCGKESVKNSRTVSCGHCTKTQGYPGP